MIVSLTGEVTIAAAQAVKSQLVAALCSGQEIHVDCQGVTEIDVAGLQLLLAAQKSAHELGLRFSVPAEIRGPVLAEAITAAGLAHAFETATGGG
jgi:anti-anti-sigma regulatory factor